MSTISTRRSACARGRAPPARCRPAVGRRRREPLGAGLLRHHLQLLDGGRAVDVGRDRQHLLLALLDQVLGELGGGRGLAGALQAGHQDHRRRLRREVEVGDAFAHRRGELAVHDADQRLAGRERPGHLGAERALLDAGDEVAHDRQRDVGLEQRHAHFAQHVLHVLFGDAGLAAHRLDEATQAVGESGSHRSCGPRRDRQYTSVDDSIVRSPAPAPSRRWRWRSAGRASWPWRATSRRRSRATLLGAACASRLLVGWLAHGIAIVIDVAGFGSAGPARASASRRRSRSRSGWSSRSTSSRAASFRCRRAPHARRARRRRRRRSLGCFRASCIRRRRRLGAAALAARLRVVRPLRRRGAACAAAQPRRAAVAARAAAAPLRRRRACRCCGSSD